MYKCEEIRMQNHLYDVTSTMQNKHIHKKKNKRKYAKISLVVISGYHNYNLILFFLYFFKFSMLLLSDFLFFNN